MGRRHLRGYVELARVRPSFVELAAVVDVDRGRAEFVADEVEELLGRRPVSCTSIEDAKSERPELIAADIVTSAGSHHLVAVEAIEAGLHVLVEKPVAVTCRAIRCISEAAERSKRIVSVAENFRRDPIIRLAQALLEADAIGEVQTVVEVRAGGGDSMLITPWRHYREDGGPLMDVGVHYADMLLYFMGPVRRVYGVTRLLEPVRDSRQGHAAPGGMYERFRDELPDEVRATAPDSLYAVLEFESGVVGTWGLDLSSKGPGNNVNMVLGSEGRLDTAGVRNGQPLRIWREGREEPLDPANVLALAPDFTLDRLTAQLFDGDRLTQYEMEFTEADSKLIAVEIWELALAIENGDPVEVDISAGEAAVALVLAVHESSETRQAVDVADVVAGRVSPYQDITDSNLGLID